ncbi:MAG: hypothetical protein M3Q83_05035 [Pseudomonadota bacterium]|nr:hypothetical protein [Pseudomonadota bacterium]
MRSLLHPLVIVLLPGAAAAAQAGPNATTAAPPRIVIPIVAPGCDTPTDGAIVVCGRKNDRYRIDPKVLAALRSRDAQRGLRPEARTMIFNERCSAVGGTACPGQNVVPISSMLIVAVTALVKIARGEDLLPMLKTIPDDYELFKQAKAREEAGDSAAPE